MELQTDLRLASDRLLKTLEQLEALENEKRALAPGSQRFQKLAREIERLAAVVFAQTHAQQRLGERAQVATERSGVDIVPIEETEQMRDLQLILGDWRDAERRLAATDPDSAEHATAAADVGRLRDEYHRAYSTSSVRRADTT
jgi:hypothetical protein